MDVSISVVLVLCELVCGVVWWWFVGLVGVG